MYGRLKPSYRLLLEINLDQSHNYLKHWEMQLEFQVPLSAAETNRALLIFNFHLHSASLEWLLQRHKIWRLKERAICTAQEMFEWNSSFSNDPVKPI
jgi:hypothetical protein